MIALHADITPADFSDTAHTSLPPMGSRESGAVGSLDLSGLPSNATVVSVAMNPSTQTATFTDLGGGTVDFTPATFKGIPGATSIPTEDINGDFGRSGGNWVRSGPMTNILAGSMQVGFGAAWATTFGGTCKGFSYTGQYGLVGYISIDSVSPSSGSAGDTVTLTGNFFGSESVTFGGASATDVTYINDSIMTCTVPTGSGLTDVVISFTNSGSDFFGSYNFTYTSTLTGGFSFGQMWQVDTPIGTLYQSSGPQPDDFLLAFDVFLAGILYPAGSTYEWFVNVTPPTDTGYWLSIDETFAGASYIVNDSRPKDPRGFTEIVGFATGSTGMMGGFPGPSCVWNNHFVYAEGLYTPATTPPVIRIFDGEFDRPVTTLPNTSSGAVPKGIMSMLTANGTVYLSTYDTGTSSSDFTGRVFTLDIDSGQITPIGSVFPTGHIPYALAWHAGRLWCGTHRQDTTAVGKIFYFRPGIDTTWTADYTLSTSGVKSCTSLLSYLGKLYVGTTNASGSFAKVLVRSELGAYTTADTGSGGTASDNNAYLALTLFGTNLYASFWNPDGTAVSKIRKFDGSSWSTVYTGSGSTNIPYVGFPTDNFILLAIGGGHGYSAALLSTPDGTTWSDRSAFLSQVTPASTGIPVFGVVMHS